MAQYLIAIGAPIAGPTHNDRLGYIYIEHDMCKSTSVFHLGPNRSVSNLGVNQRNYR